MDGIVGLVAGLLFRLNGFFVGAEMSFFTVIDPRVIGCREGLTSILTDASSIMLPLRSDGRAGGGGLVLPGAGRAGLLP